jgi:hypothetical protein
MESDAKSVKDAIDQLACNDLRLKRIRLCDKRYAGILVRKMATSLVKYPNVVTVVSIHRHPISNVTGIKLAQYVAISPTIEVLSLSDNYFYTSMYLEMAAAMRVNTSLRIIRLYCSFTVNRSWIEAAFIEALRINPNRPDKSEWYFYSCVKNEFPRLKAAADELGHPSLQLLLCAQLDRFTFQTIRHL